MTITARGTAMRASAIQCGGTLLERVTGGPIAPPATASPLAWVASVAPQLAPVDACAIVEHLFGVRPLIDACFEAADDDLEAVAAGATVGALGFFTPTPDHRWGDAPMTASPAGRRWSVRGEARIANRIADGSIVLVRTGDACRLAWLHHHAPGVEIRIATDGGARGRQSSCWIVANDAAIDAAHLSRPVGLEPGDDLFLTLDRYASVWALVAIDWARRAIRDLRRAVRMTRRGSEAAAAFGASQVIAMAIAELEIETELTIAATQQQAARLEPRSAVAGDGLAVALAVARVLSTVAARTIDLRDQLGLSLETPLAEDGVAAMVTSHLGGVMTLTQEVARARGFGDGAAR